MKTKTNRSQACVMYDNRYGLCSHPSRICSYPPHMQQARLCTTATDRRLIVIQTGPRSVSGGCKLHCLRIFTYQGLSRSISFEVCCNFAARTLLVQRRRPFQLSCRPLMSSLVPSHLSPFFFNPFSHPYHLLLFFNKCLIMQR